MRIRKIIAATTIVFALTTTFSLAKHSNFEPTVKDNQPRVEQKENQNQDEKKIDPIKVLERKKEKIKKLHKEGKITKEKAEEKLKKIDKKIEEVKEFQKLPLEQKRERVINNFKRELDMLVRDGKMKPEEAERLLKEVTEKIKNWDGSGYPMIQNNFKRIKR